MKEAKTVILTTEKNGAYTNLVAIVSFNDGSRTVLPLSVTWGKTIDRKKTFFLCMAVNEVIARGTDFEEVQTDDDIPF